MVDGPVASERIQKTSMGALVRRYLLERSVGMLRSKSPIHVQSDVSPRKASIGGNQGNILGTFVAATMELWFTLTHAHSLPLLVHDPEETLRKQRNIFMQAMSF